MTNTGAADSITKMCAGILPHRLTSMSPSLMCALVKRESLPQRHIIMDTQQALTGW